MSKYDPLWWYIQIASPAILTFNEVERVCGFPIDHSFLNAKKELDAWMFGKPMSFNPATSLAL